MKNYIVVGIKILASVGFFWLVCLYPNVLLVTVLVLLAVAFLFATILFIKKHDDLDL